jgi:hypothetical protein
MPGSGRMQGRIRRGRPLPSQPLREHRGSRTRARYREKNAPLRRRLDARNPFQATFNLSISVLRKLWKSFVRGFHTSGAIRRNQTQSGAIRRNQTHSDAISMPGALCFRVFVFWAGRKGLCFVFLCFGLAQQACVLCFRVLADPPQNTARGQDNPISV